MLSGCEDHFDTSVTDWLLLPPEEFPHTALIHVTNCTEDETVASTRYEPIGIRESAAEVTNTWHVQVIIVIV